MSYGLSQPFTTRRQDASSGGSKKSKSQAKAWNALLMLTILCLLGAGTYRFVNSSITPQMVRVVAAACDIPVGCKLGFRQLHYLDMPIKYASPDMARSMEELAGRVNRRFVAAGEPIKGYDLFPVRQRLAADVGANERAITLSLPSDCLVDSSLCPGDRVDVIATTNKNNHDYAVTLCQNVSVIVCDAKEMVLGNKSRPGELRVVTISASEADCEKLSLAAGQGAKLRLVLRNPGMKELICSRGADDNDLIPPRARGQEAHGAREGQGAQRCMPRVPPSAVCLPAPPSLLAAPPAATAAGESSPSESAGWTVEIIRGTVRETQQF